MLLVDFWTIDREISPVLPKWNYFIKYDLEMTAELGIDNFFSKMFYSTISLIYADKNVLRF